MPLTRIPRGPNSCASDLLRFSSAAFAAPDLQRPLEVGVVERQEAVEAQAHGADVVDQDVEAAVGLKGPGHQRGGAVRRGEIERDGRDAVAALERAGRARRRHDAGALGGERVGDGQPDALARPRDDGDPVGEMEIHRRTVHGRP
jgi:hypothetical protein